MREARELERHRKARIFTGRLAELQVAEWLELNGWTVSGLEALGAAHDIQAIAPGAHTTTSIEVKTIGVEDVDFEMIVASLKGTPSRRVFSLTVRLSLTSASTWLVSLAGEARSRQV